jgi:hypothetical protein
MAMRPFLDQDEFENYGDLFDEISNDYQNTTLQ